MPEDLAPWASLQRLLVSTALLVAAVLVLHALSARFIRRTVGATELRRRILLAFESAEYEGDEASRRAALTFGIDGAGQVTKR